MTEKAGQLRTPRRTRCSTEGPQTLVHPLGYVPEGQGAGVSGGVHVFVVLRRRSLRCRQARVRRWRLQRRRMRGCRARPEGIERLAVWAATRRRPFGGISTTIWRLSSAGPWPRRTARRRCGSREVGDLGMIALVSEPSTVFANVRAASNRVSASDLVTSSAASLTTDAASSTAAWALPDSRDASAIVGSPYRLSRANSSQS